MIAINQVLADMRTAIQNDGFPDEASIASLLGLDVSAATITRTDNGLVSVVGARLDTSHVGVVAAPAPKRSLDLIFTEPSIAVGPCLAGRLEADQRVEPSKQGPGIAITFSRGRLKCGVTASGIDGVIEALFCTDTSEREAQRL